VSPYRDETAIHCPRCRRALTGFDIAQCGCGTWVSAFAAPVLLEERELRPDPITRWWRKREPCPVCEDQMTLRGDEPGLFQGCDLHGFWVDADTVEHTGLARGIDHDALQRRRNDDASVEAHQQRVERLLAERAAQREGRAVRENIVDQAVTVEPSSEHLELSSESLYKHQIRMQREHARDALREAERRERLERERMREFEQALRSQLGYSAATVLLGWLDRLEKRVAELESALARR
jgi:hypothetical protein